MSASIATALRAQAAALIAVAEALESQPPAGPPPVATAASPTDPAPAKRGRGRPVAGEPASAPAASPVATATPEPVAQVVAATEADPFDPKPDAPTAPTPPPATRDEVSAALRALSAATSQENALAVLKKHGDNAANLTDLKPAFYGAVAAAAKAALATGVPAPVAPEPDPFEASAPAPVAEAEKLPTREEVKAVVVATQKRASTEVVQKILIEHGGKAEDANRVMQPSLRALPEANFVKFIAALNALPATK